MLTHMEIMAHYKYMKNSQDNTVQLHLHHMNHMDVLVQVDGLTHGQKLLSAFFC